MDLWWLFQRYHHPDFLRQRRRYPSHGKSGIHTYILPGSGCALFMMVSIRDFCVIYSIAPQFWFCKTSQASFELLKEVVELEWFLNLFSPFSLNIIPSVLGQFPTGFVNNQTLGLFVFAPFQPFKLINQLAVPKLDAAGKGKKLFTEINLFLKSKHQWLLDTSSVLKMSTKFWITHSSFLIWLPSMQSPSKLWINETSNIILGNCVSGAPSCFALF